MANIGDKGTYQNIEVRVTKVNSDGTLNLEATAPSENPQKFTSVDAKQFTAAK